MKRISIIVFLCVLIVDCDGKDKPKKPSNLISKNKMEHILYDLYVINAAKGVNRRILEDNGFIPETYVLTKHNIDSAQFVDSNAYYAFDTDTYEDIVENVKDRIEKQKEEFEELEKIEGQAAKRRRDSLEKIKQRKKDSVKKLNTVKGQDSIKIF